LKKEFALGFFCRRPIKVKALLLVVLLCVSTGAFAFNSGASFQAVNLDLSNIFTNYMGIGTASIDKAQFAQTVLNIDAAGKPGITGAPGVDFCLTVDVAGFTFAKAKGLLYDNGSMGSALEGVGFGCKVSGLHNLFSGFVCTYENILSDVMGDAVCSFQAFLQSPVQVLATLYLVCLGIMFATGIMAFTASEAMISAFKVCLVVALTANADFTVYYLYRIVMLIAQNGTNMVISSISLVGLQTILNGANALLTQMLNAIGIVTAGGDFVGGLSGYQGILQTMDSFVNEFIYMNSTSPDDLTCKNGYLSMVLGLFGSVPLLGLMLMGLFYSLAMLLMKVLFSYLKAITGIMFLVSMSPMFIAFSLFRFTEKIFGNWLKYLVGYALHIVIIFAFVSFASSLGLNMLFKQLFAQPGPYKQDHTAGVASIQTNQCTFCPKTEFANTKIVGTFTLPLGRQCKAGIAGENPEEQSKDLGSSNPLDWLSLDQGFMSFAAGRIILMLVIVKLLSAVLERAPEIASSISRVDTDDRRVPGRFGARGASSSKTTGGTTR
jgi:hypothetical protein